MVKTKSKEDTTAKTASQTVEPKRTSRDAEIKAPCPHEDCRFFEGVKVWPEDGIADKFSGPCRDCRHFVKFDFYVPKDGEK